MNKYTLLVAGLLGAAALTAQAGELYQPQQYQDSTPSLTRAQVKQEVLQARRNGELNHNDIDLPGNGVSVPDASFGRTRASVQAETLAARRTGELEHNDVDLPNVAKGSVLSRQQVKAEAIASRQLVHTAPGRNTIDY
jgi:hypothetical protein